MLVGRQRCKLGVHEITLHVGCFGLYSSFSSHNVHNLNVDLHFYRFSQIQATQFVVFGRMVKFDFATA